ncbi:hypothetical protein GQ55_1G451600 [Panicum hallii var. hallii]|uniref:Protein kinase domain-containing protein n=1 Tax=Panicum hallii var. hallii TaxID=1504633 RepID=A0A2T7FEB7_9POAL|nr:hypothetical protein GQ55_1G451600 [Panicum hallii var. hallii]
MVSCFISCLRRAQPDDGDPCTSPSAQNSPLLHTTRKFTLAQLSAATGGFRSSNLVGEGGFGRVAVKKLRRGGAQGSREFMVECTMLMLLHHPNVVSLVGYCAQAQERLLVYEFFPRGSLDAHLFPAAAGGQGQEPNKLGWDARVKVAVGTARGLRYLHEVVTPPVIYRDLKPSNILLGDDLSPMLSDLGLAKLGPVSDDTHVSTRVMGTYGYCAPDYAVTGKLSIKSDVYSFGVVLLELITGRRAIDAGRDEEQRLLVWARPYLQQLQLHGRGRLLDLEGLADPALQGRYPRRGLYQAAVIASLCLHDKPNLRPTMSDVTKALEHVASQPWVAAGGSVVDDDRQQTGGSRRGAAAAAAAM